MSRATRAAPLAWVEKRLSAADGVGLALVVSFGLWMLAPDLGHPGIHDWDEAFHQAAARGTHESFFFPHLWEDPLYPVPPHHWWGAQVWLHKPVAPFWFAALVMHLTGVTPLALRLASLLGQLGAAVASYFLARPLSRVWGLAASMGFLALPFGWVLTQGLLFGDVTDTTLAGFVSLAMLLLVHSVERDSWRWAAASGAAVGVAILCKTVLALTPLGVALVMAGLRAARLGRGPRLFHLASMYGAAAIVSVPWNAYCAWRWPEVFRTSVWITFGHVSEKLGADVGPWARPLDAIFNEVNGIELGPAPVILPVLAAGWLLVRAVRFREPFAVATALWIWATWGVLTFMNAKVPAIAWGAVPGVLVALAVLARDALRSPVLACTAVTGVFTPNLSALLPSLARVRELAPSSWVQTRSLAGLAEGAALCLVAGAVGAVVLLASRRWRAAVLLPAAAVTLSLGWLFFWKMPLGLKAQREQYERKMSTSYTREVGLALDRALPQKSVLWLVSDMEPPGSLEGHGLLFWAGRMAYRRAPDLEAARAKGYHSYLVSSVAEPFAEVPGVPAHAWLRAYDAEVPAPPPAIPAGALRLDVKLGGMEVLGMAAGAATSSKGQYAFFVRSEGPPARLSVSFVLRDGGRISESAEPEAALRSRHSLAGVPWFVLPVLGPPTTEVAAVELGAEAIRVAVDGERFGG